ncbi:MAG: hypothetical protein PHV39_05060 [Methanomicrobium sp.]|nr:hypothetical protein [Methanomicrobium sp.]
MALFGALFVIALICLIICIINFLTIPIRNFLGDQGLEILVRIMGPGFSRSHSRA